MDGRVRGGSVGVKRVESQVSLWVEDQRWDCGGRRVESQG